MLGWTGQKGQGAGKKYIKGSEGFVFCRLFFFFLFSFMVVELLTDQWSLLDVERVIVVTESE